MYVTHSSLPSCPICSTVGARSQPCDLREPLWWPAKRTSEKYGPHAIFQGCEHAKALSADYPMGVVPQADQLGIEVAWIEWAVEAFSARAEKLADPAYASAVLGIATPVKPHTLWACPVCSTPEKIVQRPTCVMTRSGARLLPVPGCTHISGQKVMPSAEALARNWNAKAKENAEKRGDADIIRLCAPQPEPAPLA